MTCKRPTTESLTKWLRDNLILILTLSGVLLGVVLGVTLRPLAPSPTTIHLISYPGELFMRILKLFILPLVISSIISGSASLNAKTNGKMAVRTLAYFGFTTLINSVWGTMLAIMVHPGNPNLRDGMEQAIGINSDVKPLDSFLDLGRLTPIGVASIICGKILSINKLMLLLESLGLYIVTNIGGVVVYQAVVMPLLFLLFVRKNPFTFWWGLLPAELTAFATASTAVALPLSFKCMDKMGYDERVTHFVLPIGSTVNMDGTAMFVSIASIFVAQLNKVPLLPGDYATILFTSAAASVAAASIPSAALVLMLIVLSAIGCPSEDVAILYTVDWLVDRFRTTNNMLGDCYTAAVVEKLSQKELQEMTTANHVYKPVENGYGNGTTVSDYTDTTNV